MERAVQRRLHGLLHFTREYYITRKPVPPPRMQQRLVLRGWILCDM